MKIQNLQDKPDSKSKLSADELTPKVKLKKNNKEIKISSINR